MPILGVIASSRLTAEAGSYDFIATGTASGSSPTLVFSSIPQTYKHLELRYVGRNGREAQEAGYLGIRLNSNYALLVQTMYNFSNNLPAESSFGPAGQNTGYQLAATGSSTNSASMGTGIINIPDYTNTSKLKMARIMSAAVTGGPSFMNHSTSTFNFTSAVTSLEIYGVDGANISANSKFSLYGLKDS
jgi:hypothetical protein